MTIIVSWNVQFTSLRNFKITWKLSPLDSNTIILRFWKLSLTLTIDLSHYSFLWRLLEINIDVYTQRTFYFSISIITLCIQRRVTLGAIFLSIKEYEKTSSNCHLQGRRSERRLHRICFGTKVGPENLFRLWVFAFLNTNCRTLGLSPENSEIPSTQWQISKTIWFYVCILGLLWGI